MSLRQRNLEDIREEARDNIPARIITIDVYMYHPLSSYHNKQILRTFFLSLKNTLRNR